MVSVKAAGLVALLAATCPAWAVGQTGTRPGPAPAPAVAARPGEADANESQARLAIRMGRPDEAEAPLRRALELREASDPGSVASARTMHSLAAVVQGRGKAAEAEALFRKALAIRERAQGPDHAETAAALQALGMFLVESGDRKSLPEAVGLLRRAGMVREKALGANHPDVAMSYTAMAMSTLTLAWQTGAIRKRGLGDRARGGAEAPVVVTADGQKEVELAEWGIRRSLAIREKALGPADPAVGASLQSLASLRIMQGRDVEAEPLLKRSLAIFDAAYPPDHPEIARTLDATLAMVKKLHNDPRGRAEARDLQARLTALRDRDRQVRRTGELPIERPTLRGGR